MSVRIVLTEQAPVRVDEAKWPVVASVKRRGHVNPFLQSKADGHSLVIRQHGDGRTIVSGSFRSVCERTAVFGGEVLAPVADIPAAIKRVANSCGLPKQAVRECISRLPEMVLE